MAETTTSYKVEFAKTGRSSCKKCKEKLQKDEIRLGVDTPNGEYTMTSWYHPSCFSLPRKFAAKITAEEFVQKHVADVSEEMNILPDKLEEIAEAIASSKATPKKKNSGDPFIAKLKEDFEASTKDDDEDDKKAVKKKRKASEITDSQHKRAVELYGKYHGMKADELKDLLRHNRQVLKGTKDVMLHKVIDGELRGRLSFCNCCDGGKLKLSDDCTKVVCLGTFDEASQIRIPCDVTYSLEDAPRSKLPWLTSEPTKEQDEAMDKEKETALGGGLGGDQPLATLMEKAKDLDIDMSSSGKIKESTAKMVEFLEASEQKLDLPDGDKQAFKSCGEIMARNKQATPDEMVKLIVEKHGFVEAKAKKAAKKEDAAQDACENPENAALYCAFLELAQHYFKEGNKNTGATYTKTAAAIKGIPIAVTAENAKSFSSGKNKLAGIGKGSADKMYEFVTTGTMEKLDEKRQNAA